MHPEVLVGVVRWEQLASWIFFVVPTPMTYLYYHMSLDTLYSVLSQKEWIYLKVFVHTHTKCYNLYIIILC